MIDGKELESHWIIEARTSEVIKYSLGPNHQVEGVREVQTGSFAWLSSYKYWEEWFLSWLLWA